MRSKGSLIIANALIWGALIVATAFILKGTEYRDRMLAVIGAGFTASTLVVGTGGKRDDPTV
jgi:hypothetical protein